jgi:hypothetical protein
VRIFIVVLLILALGSAACQATSTNPPSINTSIPTIPLATEGLIETATTSASPSTEESTATSIATALPNNVIQVDTLEQEVYPFVENGKCSFAEAIIAANSGEPQDSCAAGVQGEAVIELMPGEYHFTQPDQSPPQFEWLATIVEVGNALPPVVYPLTIQGNGATLIRDEGSQPFRFFELVINSTLTMNDVTLQNGDVGEDDWGGAIYVSMASLNLNGVRFVGNRASDGGGIYLTMSTLILTDCEFTENHVYSSGGGVHFDAAKGLISNSRFVGNTTDTHGAAIASDSTTLVIEDSLFLKNINKGTSGGALYMEHVNVLITRSEFYQNQTDWTGGAIYIMNPFLIGASDEEGNALEELIRSSPDIQTTLESHPSGMFQEDFREASQIHDSCFANNIIVDPKEINFSSALQARMANATDNYWGLPNGPSGMGPGFGDGVAKEIEFMPFLTETPAHCDPELSIQVQENHNK